MSFLFKYAPTRPELLIGRVQRQIAETYIEQIEAGEPITPQLLYGNTGVGKTSIANIVYQKLNEVGGAELIHYNCVDTSGKADATEIVNGFYTNPLMGKYKVFLLDEIHQLSSAAQNAFLIPLDNLVKRQDGRIVVFATTTSLESVKREFYTRFNRVNLPNPTYENMKTLVNAISSREKIAISDDDIRYLINLSNGSVRDLVTNLDEFAKGNRKEELAEENESLDFIKLLKKVDFKNLMELEGNYTGLLIRACYYAIKVVASNPTEEWAMNTLRVFGPALNAGQTISKIYYASLIIDYLDKMNG